MHKWWSIGMLAAMIAACTCQINVNMEKLM